MKIDMHCHVKEGSIDSKLGIIEYAQRLISSGIDGMVVTDHNSLKGYRAWSVLSEDDKQRNGLSGFKVFKGVEYDTLDCGHMLIILPDNVRGKVFELRGMPVILTVWLVHQLGGIIGPAHPYYGTIMGIASNKIAINNEILMKSFDFIEVCNACESDEHNTLSKELASKYNLIGTAGSDAHRKDCVGMAYTEFTGSINTTNELIRAIENESRLNLYCKNYDRTVKNKHKVIYEAGRAGFWLWHKGISKIYDLGRIKRIEEISEIGINQGGGIKSYGEIRTLKEIKAK